MTKEADSMHRIRNNATFYSLTFKEECMATGVDVGGSVPESLLFAVYGWFRGTVVERV